MPTASEVSQLLRLNLDIADFGGFVPFIRNGFPRHCFDEFISTTTIATAITELATFKNLADNTEELSPEASDCLLRIARIYAEALELIGNKADVANWLTNKSHTLGDQTPLELMDTTIGFEMVFRERFCKLINCQSTGRCGLTLIQHA